MTAAVRLAIDDAFDELDLRIVRGRAAVGNVASRHVLEAAGMRFEGIRRLDTTIRPSGEPARTDTATYDMTRDEWHAPA